MNDLFQNVNGKLVPRDVCARKHGGNEQSNAAFETVKSELTFAQIQILDTIKCYGQKTGFTVDELSDWWGKTPNAISGRITELRIMGKIEKRGIRKTRSGCSAAVWVAI